MTSLAHSLAKEQFHEPVGVEGYRAAIVKAALIKGLEQRSAEMLGDLFCERVKARFEPSAIQLSMELREFLSELRESQ